MTFDDFLPHVLPSVHGCPDSVAVDHVVKAARLFCARTLVWNYACAPIAAEAGQGTYTLQLGENQELVRLLAVDVDGRSYTVPKQTYGRTETRRGTSGLATMTNAFDFTLSPPPSIEGTPIVTDVAVKPTLTSSYWPDDLADHVTDIAHGAISSLCLLPRQEWTNPSLASIEQGMFTDRISVVGIKVARGLGSNTQPARVTWF